MANNANNKAQGSELNRCALLNMYTPECPFRRTPRASDYLLDSDVERLFREEYPSAYHPPPFNSKEQVEIIFLALSPHFGQLIERVPILTSSSEISPQEHSNS
jgi:hypothetical protein